MTPVLKYGWISPHSLVLFNRPIHYRFVINLIETAFYLYILKNVILIYSCLLC